MYSLRNIFKQEPQAISGAVVAILNVLWLANVLPFDDKLLAAINVALVLLLSLFYVRPLTASKSALRELSAPRKRR